MEIFDECQRLLELAPHIDFVGTSRCEPDLGALPGVLPSNLCHREVEAIADSLNDGTNDAALLFQ